MIMLNRFLILKWKVKGVFFLKINKLILLYNNVVKKVIIK